MRLNWETHLELIQAWQIYLQSRASVSARDVLYRQIWSRYHKRILYFIRQSISGEAEDLVQDVMLKVFENLDRYNPVYSFSTWIFTIARNHMINWLRKKRLSTTAIPQAVPDPLRITPEQQFIVQESREQIESLIQTLDPDQRQMVYLYYYEEMKVRQIAQILDMPAGTVKSRLYWIRNRLRSQLGESNE